MSSRLRRTKGLTDFAKKVLGAIKKIPKGRVTTYGEVARAIGRPKAVRAVGRALHKNPYAPKWPCHRVVKSDGGIGGYAGGVNRKIGLLNKEGVLVGDKKIIEFEKVLYKF